jgi:hypothetical protein
MSTKTDKLKLSDTEQFSDLASRLQSQVDDQTVLAEIHVAIKELLSNNRATETRILEILQRRFDSGDLRPETFELVHKMLDRIRSETVTPAGDGTKTLVLDREPSGHRGRGSTRKNDGQQAASGWLDSARPFPVATAGAR